TPPGWKGDSLEESVGEINSNAAGQGYPSPQQSRLLCAEFGELQRHARLRRGGRSDDRLTRRQLALDGVVVAFLRHPQDFFEGGLTPGDEAETLLAQGGQAPPARGLEDPRVRRALEDEGVDLERHAQH